MKRPLQSLPVFALCAALLSCSDLPTVMPGETPEPVLLQPDNGATNVPLDVLLTWQLPPTHASGPMTCQLQVATDQGFVTPVYDSSGLTSSSQHIPALKVNTTYFWRVRATGPAGTGPWSGSVRSFTTVTTTDTPLNFPLKVGTTWTYWHSYYYYSKDGETISRRGLHTWTLTSADTLALPHTYHFMAHTEDSVHHRKVTATVWDTTYQVAADIPFTGSRTADSLTIRWLVTLGKADHGDVQRVPLVLSGSGDLYHVAVGEGNVYGSKATFQSGRGLVTFKAWLGPVMSGNFKDSLGLRTLTVP